MPATETVGTLAASFEGMGGALSLSVIAFSVVFLVLAGLTLVIFGMRFITQITSGKKAEKAAPVTKTAPVAAPAAAAPAESACEDEELIAVITAAIAAESGSMVSVRSITEVTGEPRIGTGNCAWIACNRLEGLQGNMPCNWR